MSQTSPHPSPSTPLISPVRYVPAFEGAMPDEDRIAAEIGHMLGQIQEKTWQDSKHAMRGMHAKSHGLLIGELAVREHLPAELAQGMFAKPARYPVVMRFSTSPGEMLEDSVSTPRGLALKVIGVEGPRVEGSGNDVTQDFVLHDRPVFSAANPNQFLANLKLLAPVTDRMEAVKKLTSAVARGAEAVVETFGGKSARLTAFGGHPETNILGETFYSATPILYGIYMAKLGVFPATPKLTELTGKPMANNGEPNMLRNFVVDFFLKENAAWEVRVQLCTNPETMPLEDASREWPQAESPYITVARLEVPKQDAWNAETIEAIDERLAFDPWHALAAHRPLGGINRIRNPAYRASAGFRAARKEVELEEPKSLEEMTNRWVSRRIAR
jgi:hypothetical protein